MLERIAGAGREMASLIFLIRLLRTIRVTLPMKVHEQHGVLRLQIRLQRRVDGQDVLVHRGHVELCHLHGGTDVGTTGAGGSLDSLVSSPCSAIVGSRRGSWTNRGRRSRFWVR